MTPKDLFKAYTGVKSDKDAAKAIINMITTDLAKQIASKTSIAGKLPSNAVIWQIVEEQKGKFFCFCNLAKEFYGDDIVPRESYFIMLKNSAPEIYMVWKWQENK
jgi:hypothetical protein